MVCFLAYGIVLLMIIIAIDREPRNYDKKTIIRK